MALYEPKKPGEGSNFEQQVNAEAFEQGRKLGEEVDEIEKGRDEALDKVHERIAEIKDKPNNVAILPTRPAAEKISEGELNNIGLEQKDLQLPKIVILQKILTNEKIDIKKPDAATRANELQNLANNIEESEDENFSLKRAA